jgi:hypothetical protein
MRQMHDFAPENTAGMSNIKGAMSRVRATHNGARTMPSVRSLVKRRIP